MGWLWTCLRGKHGVQPYRICAGRSTAHSSSSGGGSSQSDSSRFQQHLSVHRPKQGQRSAETFKRRAVQSSYKCGEPEGGGNTIKVPVSSVSTCISSNTLLKASEGRTVRSFLSDNGSSLRSDVDELKEELAALRRRLAAEEEEAKRLREEVNYLRSCGVLHKPESCYQAQASKSRETLYPQDSKPLSICDDATDMRKQQNRDGSVKQFQRCFSGPLSWTGSLDESLSLPRDASIGSVAAAEVNGLQQVHAKVLQPVHSFKPQFQLYHTWDEQNIHSERSNPTGDNGPDTKILGGMVSRTSTSGLSYKNSSPTSTSLASWAILEKENLQTLQENGKVESLGSINGTTQWNGSTEVQWIEVHDGPCPSGPSTNVKLSPNSLKDNAKSPHKSSLQMWGAVDSADTLLKDLQKARKRRQRRVAHQEPIANQANDRSLSPVSSNHAILSGPFEDQSSSVVESFNQQQQAQLSLTSSSPSNVGSLFGTSRKRSMTFRSRGFWQPLSPVKEALSTEEVSLSGKSEVEQVLRNHEMPCSAGVTLSDSNRNQSFETSAAPEDPEAGTEKQPEGIFDANGHAPSRLVGSTDLEPVQCASPSPSPRKWSASREPDVLSNLPVSSNTALGSPVVEPELLSGVEGKLVYAVFDNAFASDDDGEEVLPLQCASPTFTPKRKPSRSAVYQATEFKRNELPSLLNSAESMGSRDHELLPRFENQVIPLPSTANSSCWTLSPENIDFHPNISDQQGHADAGTDAMQSISCIQFATKEQESMPPKETDPVGKQWHQNTRPLQVKSAEKEVAKQDFLSYVYDTDEKRKTDEKECTIKMQQETEQQIPIEDCKTPPTSLVMSRVQYWNSVHKSASSDEKSSSDSKKGGRKRDGKEASMDSSETNSVSTTFSIDLGCTENSPINYESCSEFEGSDSYYESSAQPLVDVDGTDKEDVCSRCSRGLLLTTPSKHASVFQEQSAPSSGSNKQSMMLSQGDRSPKGRPILGVVPAANWENILAQSPQLWDGKGEPNLTHKYKEDQRVNWHGTPFEVRVERALANQSDVSPRMLFGGVSTNLQDQTLSQPRSDTTEKDQDNLGEEEESMAGSSVVLMSGGIESAALLYHWRSSASRLHPLYINYGQKGATMEEQACNKLCQHLDLKLGRIDMSSVGEEFRALQQPAKSFVPLPHRNLVILALGASYACQVGSRVIALALNKDDLGSYSSSSQSFLDSFRATAATLKPSLTLVAPLSHLTKAQVVTFGNHLGVPFADTYSCMVGRPRHCGHCHQCKLRRQAFAHISIEEPPGFYEQ